MLAHRLRRWANINTALGECLVFVRSYNEYSSWPFHFYSIFRRQILGDIMSRGIITILTWAVAALCSDAGQGGSLEHGRGVEQGRPGVVRGRGRHVAAVRVGGVGGYPRAGRAAVRRAAAAAAAARDETQGWRCDVTGHGGRGLFRLDWGFAAGAVLLVVTTWCIMLLWLLTVLLLRGRLVLLRHLLLLLLLLLR